MAISRRIVLHFPSARLVDFSDTKCIVCGLCIKACPLRAMVVRF